MTHPALRAPLPRGRTHPGLRPPLPRGDLYLTVTSYNSPLLTTSEVHYHVAICDGNRVGPKFERRINQVAARLDVEFPAVPRAAKHLAFESRAILIRLGRQVSASNMAETDGPLVMYACVPQGAKNSVHVEDSDASSGNGHELSRARWNFRGWADDVPCHLRPTA